jgi:hypothetical protein
VVPPVVAPPVVVPPVVAPPVVVPPELVVPPLPIIPAEPDVPVEPPVPVVSGGVVPEQALEKAASPTIRFCGNRFNVMSCSPERSSRSPPEE